jgi:hypothetical protein
MLDACSTEVGCFHGHEHKKNLVKNILLVLEIHVEATVMPLSL